MARYKLVRVDEFENSGCAVLLVVILFLVYVGSEVMTMFTLPTDADLNSDKYRGLAEKQAQNFLLQQQEKTWKSLGFTSSTGAKSYDVSVDSNYEMYDTNGKRISTKDISERTKYINNYYQVLSATKTSLSATSADGKTTWKDKLVVHQNFIVTVSVNPVRRWYGKVDLNWHLIDVQQISVSPSIEEINDAIYHWSIPPNKTPGW